MHCPHCDSRVTKKNKFCPECGREVVWEENSRTSGTKSNRALIVIGVLLLIAVIVVSALIALGGVEGVKNAITGNKTVAFSDNPEAIAVASQSVIKLNCYDKGGNLYTTGSGFACFEDDIIVTNYHVIQDNVYSIKASTEDGTTFEITNVVATDKDRDIAILQTATPHNLTLLQTGNSSTLQKGERVVAIGSPLGLLNTVSTGVFSGYTNEDGMDVLQFTASISSGSSGGALFNDAGEVLGITYASYEAGQNLNLAVPVAEVERVWNKRPDYSMSIETFYSSRTTTGIAGYGVNIPNESEIGFVSIKELKQNPKKYLDHYIALKAYVSSVDVIGDTFMVGIYLSSVGDVTGDQLSDSIRQLNEPFEIHPFVYASTFDVRKISVQENDQITIKGLFKIDASGYYMIDAYKIDL